MKTLLALLLLIPSLTWGKNIEILLKGTFTKFTSLCYFDAYALNKTKNNITMIHFEVKYYDKDGYVIDKKIWTGKGLVPNKTVEIEAFVSLPSKNDKCPDYIGKVILTPLKYVKIDGSLLSINKDAQKLNSIYESIKLLNETDVVVEKLN